MTYHGHIEDGRVVLDEPASLPEGARVRIVLAEDIAASEAGEVPSLAEQLSGLIGAAEGFPSDWAENHDKYLRDEYRR